MVLVIESKGFFPPSFQLKRIPQIKASNDMLIKIFFMFFLRFFIPLGKKKHVFFGGVEFFISAKRVTIFAALESAV